MPRGAPALQCKPTLSSVLDTHGRRAACPPLLTTPHSITVNPPRYLSTPGASTAIRSSFFSDLGRECCTKAELGQQRVSLASQQRHEIETQAAGVNTYADVAWFDGELSCTVCSDLKMQPINATHIPFRDRNTQGSNTQWEVQDRLLLKDVSRWLLCCPHVV